MSESSATAQMLKKIESGQIGFNSILQGPYGSKRSKSTLLTGDTNKAYQVRWPYCNIHDM